MVEALRQASKACAYLSVCVQGFTEAEEGDLFAPSGRLRLCEIIRRQDDVIMLSTFVAIFLLTSLSPSLLTAKEIKCRIVEQQANVAKPVKTHKWVKGESGCLSRLEVMAVWTLFNSKHTSRHLDLEYKDATPEQVMLIEQTYKQLVWRYGLVLREQEVQRKVEEPTKHEF